MKYGLIVILAKAVRRVVRYCLGNVVKLVCGTRNIIIFAGQTGYDGNSRALYEYLLSVGKDKKYKFIWCGRGDLGTMKNVKKPGTDLMVYESGADWKWQGTRWNQFAYHCKNLYYMNCAKYIFFDNLFPQCLYGKHVPHIVYETHGCPPLKNVKGMINLHHCGVTDMLITTDNIRDIFPEMVGVSSEKTFVCGQPRNDVIFNAPLKYEEILGKHYSKVILWMPTFRMFYTTDADGSRRMDSEVDYLYGLPLIHGDVDLETINECLSRNDCLLIIKPHPHALCTGIEDVRLGNIAIWTNKWLDDKGINLYALFADTSALISDYSSVAFDFLLTGNPVAYITDDMEEYKLGFAFPNVLDYMPGPKINKLDEMLCFIKDIAKGNDLYRDERRRVNDWANTYHDGQNARRMADYFNL